MARVSISFLFRSHVTQALAGYFPFYSCYAPSFQKWPSTSISVCVLAESRHTCSSWNCSFFHLLFSTSHLHSLIDNCRSDSLQNRELLLTARYTESCIHSKMRYQNWDVLLFPDQFKVPLQEFKTTCQVIQDPGKKET